MGRPFRMERGVAALTLVVVFVVTACGGSGPGTAAPPPTSGGATAASAGPGAPSADRPAASPAPATAAPTPTPTNAPLTALPSFAPGRLTTTDTDGDGTAETYVYAFPAEELTPGLTLDRTLTVEPDGAARRSTLEMTFTNTGSGPVASSYILEIPKEMAASIDDLTFSVPPTEVIDPDPTVRWKVDLVAAARLAIVATALGASQADDAGGATGPVGLIFVTRMLACEAIDDEAERAGCALDLVREFRDAGPLEKGLDRILTKMLPNICAGGSLGAGAAFYRTACLALLNGAGACAALMDLGERALCHAYLAEADCELTKAGPARDRCLFERAVAGTSTFACALIDGADARALCEAAVTKSAGACARLSTPALQDRCREALARGEAPTAAMLAPPPVEDVDPDWFPVADQNGPCRELGAGLKGWTTGKAGNRKPSQLDCLFEKAKPESTKNLGILVLPSDAEAQATFAKCCGEQPPGTAAGGGSTEGVEKKIAWEGDRFSRARGFVFSALTGSMWVDGRWADDYLVIERYRNCLIAIMTDVDYDAPPGKAPSPPELSAAVDAETASIIETAKRIIDEHLE